MVHAMPDTHDTMKTEQPPRNGRTALVVEDDAGVRRSLQLLLQSRGFDVRAFPAAAPVLAGAEVDTADVLIADYRLPDATGCDVRRALARRGWAGRSILVTGFPSADLAAEALACGFDAVLHKPLRRQVLVAALG